MMATKRDLLENEVVRISNPRGFPIIIEDISGKEIEIRVVPINHETFDSMLGDLSDLINQILSLGGFMQLLGKELAGAADPQKASSQREVSNETDASRAIADGISQAMPRFSNLIVSVIENGTNIRQLIPDFKKKVHTIVLAKVALYALKRNYGEELRELLRSGLGLMQGEQETETPVPHSE